MYGRMEVKDVRCCDTAALVALINMLKVNLESTPEIYNTLLAVLCDFDPSNHGNRERTVRYIRLLVSDKVLANCLLMSLPHGDPQFHNLSLTGSMPEMKKALRHKFLGMKLSVQSTQSRTKEQISRPADVTNQNITIIVTDQEETGNNSLNNTYNRSLLQTQPQSSSDNHRTDSVSSSDSRTSSSQTKCIITFTKSSPGNLCRDTPTSLQASAYNTVPKAVQSNPIVTLLKTGTGSQDNQSKTAVSSGNESENPTVKNSSTITLQSHGAKAALSHISQLAIINRASTYPISVQDRPQTQQTNIYSKPQARLPSAIIPLPYQQYTHPFQGNANYRPSFSGPTINPLFPWTPMHYIPGFLPNHNLAPTGHFTRHSSISVADSGSLDLSLPRLSAATAQSGAADSMENGILPSDTRKGVKRCASVTCIPTQNDEPKPKVRRLSAEIPICPNTRYIQPKTKENTNCQRVPTSGSYLCLSENRDGINKSQPNSLQALQELTSRINPKPNSLTVRKSMSTGSFSETQQDPSKLNEMQRNFVVGGPLTSTSFGGSAVAQNHYLAATHYLQKPLPAYKDFAATVKPKTNLPLTTASSQYYTASPAEKRDSWPQNVQEKHMSLAGKQLLHGQSATTQSHSITGAVPDVSSTWDLASCKSNSEKFGTVVPSNTCHNMATCFRNFPYTQQVQLPDGKYSVLDFPALVAKSNTESCGNLKSVNKNDAKVQKSGSFSWQSEISLENTNNQLDDQVSETNCSVSVYPSNSMCLERNDTTFSNQNVGKEESKSVVTPEEFGSHEVKTDLENSNKTCLIIETTSENGTEQVQFKLDKHSSASLLGELLKLKPVQNSSAYVQTGATDMSNRNNVSERNGTMLNNDGLGIDGDGFSQNITSTQNGHTLNRTGSISEADIAFSSLNVSPYLLGMLPDTTTFSDNYDDDEDFEDDDEEKEESYSDEEDDDDDVFLHPIF